MMGETRSLRFGRRLEIPKKQRTMVETQAQISNNNAYGGVDLISDLPDETIHRIMSFLPIDDLTQFSTVSKRFLSAAKSCPSLLVFDFTAFAKRSYASKHLDFELFREKSGFISNRQKEEDFSKREAFLNFVQHSIEQRRRRLLMVNDYCCMQRLSFTAPISTHYASDLRIDEMVKFALDNRFIELNLDGTINLHGGISLRRDVICRLSCTIFSSQAQDIKFLKLRGFRLDCDVEEALNVSCPSMVDFSLSHCSKFKTINLCGANLKRVVLDSIYGLEKVNIDPQVSLESFSISIYPNEWLLSPHLRGMDFSEELLFSARSIEQRFSEINIHSYKSLKYLEIKDADIITDEWFQHRVSQFDLLETLKLDSCKNLSNIYISSNNLKTLELRNCAALVDIKIIALNLESFVFHSYHQLCNINIRSSIYLKHMDVLRSVFSGLLEMGEKVDTFTGCLSPFNLLENLKLNLEHFIVQEDICISMDSLKTLELKNYFKTIKNLEIKAINLESFTFRTKDWTCGDKWGQFNLDINSCLNLRHIKLVEGGGVAYNFSGFPLLERLELEACNSMEKIELYGGKCLKSLKLLDCISLSQIAIEAPNIVSFMFSGVSTRTLPSSLLLISPPTLVPKLFVTASDLLITDSFRKSFRDFLVSFSFHNTVSLGCTFSELLIFPKEMREKLIPPLCGIKHLKVEVCTWPNSLVELVDSLLCLAPCTASMSIISLNDRVNKRLKLKFHYKPAVTEEAEADNEDVLSYEWCPIKCWWRHYLTKVEMENFEDLDERNCVQKFLIQNAKAVPSFIYL